MLLERPTTSPERLRLRTPLGLLPDARHVVLPEGICSSGLPAVEQTLSELGLGLDPWQRDAASCILGKDLLGLYAADTVLLSIARQVGKTFLIGLLVFADSIINPGTLTVWTAHRFKVSRETFDELRGLALLPEMAPHIDPDSITTGAGNETIPFRNGSRIVFAARERGSIRGFRKVRRLVLDEAQILTEAAMADLAPTQNQATNPQLILMGTPPKPGDPAETFTTLRELALSGEAEALAYIEFSADPGSSPDDRAAWLQANPSLGVRTPERALVRLRKLLANDDDFLREALGMWSAAAVKQGPIPPDVWAALADPSIEQGSPVAYSLEVALGRSSATIGCGWLMPVDSMHLTVAKHASGTDWIVETLAAACGTHSNRGVTLDAGTEALSFREPLERAGVTVYAVKSADRAAACGRFSDAVFQGRMSHDGQQLVTDALAGATWRETTEGARTFARRGGVDISPLYALVLAHHGLTTSSPSGGWMVSVR